jgi:mRNA-degrading endonuclease toxin of MazEF toxin-antitoxin module
MKLSAGQVVIVDWRDALPKEPNKRRPAIVVEDTDLFDPAYPNAILVPLSDDAELALGDLSLALIPNSRNGLKKESYALAHHVTTVSKRRITATNFQIAAKELAEIRARIAFAVGLDIAR